MASSNRPRLARMKPKLSCANQLLGSFASVSFHTESTSLYIRLCRQLNPANTASSNRDRTVEGDGWEMEGGRSRAVLPAARRPPPATHAASAAQGTMVAAYCQ